MGMYFGLFEIVSQNIAVLVDFVNSTLRPLQLGL